MQKVASLKATFKPLRRYIGNLTGKNVKTVTRRHDRLLGEAGKLKKATDSALNRTIAKLREADRFRVANHHASQAVQGLDHAALGSTIEAKRMLIRASDARKARVKTLLMGRRNAHTDAYIRHALARSNKSLVASKRLSAIANAVNTRDNTRAYTALGALGVGGAGAIAIGASRQ